MALFSVGYHIYEDIWLAVVGEELSCKGESNNLSDPYAVDVLRHVPKKILSLCSLYLYAEVDDPLFYNHLQMLFRR